MGDQRLCECGCKTVLTGSQRKWASNLHKSRVHQRMIRTAERSAKDEAANLRRGHLYDELEKLGLVDLWMENELTYEGVKLEYIDKTGDTVSMSGIIAALQAHRIDRRLNRRADEWQMDDEMRTWLALDSPWPDPNEDPEGVEIWLDAAVEGFVGFRSLFKAPRLGKYVTAGCHRRWIRAILKALIFGGKVNILSPPRHGKTELLVHFALWLICRDPDIRILWVGPNGEIAEDASGMVKDNLEVASLVARVLPPGRSFAPLRQKNWSNKSFTVDCRQTIQKSATMTAIGRGAKMLSRDVDLIISDDIEDFDNTRQPKQRTDTREWFIQDLGSRKEEPTAWVDIGSRQHYDDLRGFLVENPEWESIVEAAHEPTCQIPETDHALHDAAGCMLVPGLRTHRWLMGQKREAYNLGQPQIFDMVYQQETQIEGLQKWNREMVARTHNLERGLGIPKLPDDREPYKIAGLDPSATGWQAGFAWAIDLRPNIAKWLYMIDADNHHGGGLDPFLELAETWRLKYGIYHWVVEINMYRTGFIQEDRCVKWMQAHGVIIEPHDTQTLKMDPQYGVGAMASMYGETPVVDLPYLSTEAQVVVESYTKELLRFVDIAEVMRRRARVTNMLMASWFPMRTIRRLRIEAAAELDSGSWDDESQYGGVNLSDYDYLEQGL